MNSIEKVISKVLIDSEISHKELMLVIHEKQNHVRLNGRIRTKDSQLSDIVRGRLTEHGKKIGIDETIR